MWWSWLQRLFGDPIAQPRGEEDSESARPESEAPAGPPPDEIILGFDLGATHTTAALVRDGEVEVVPNTEGEERMASVVARTQSGDWLVGAEAAGQAVANPRGTVFDVRRLLGRRLSDLPSDGGGPELVAGPGGFVRVEIGGEQFAPQQLAALLLRNLRTAAEARLGRRVRWAVLTAPVGFDDARRQALLDAARIAGFAAEWDFSFGRCTPMRLIHEPVAVGLAHAFSTGRRGRVVVLGVCGCAALEFGDDVVEVRAAADASEAGGDPFADVTDNWTEQYRPVARRVLTDAGWRPADVDEVILAGARPEAAGMQFLAREVFGREAVASAHGDAAAAVGAAVHGEQLRLGRASRLLLMSVAPRSLGAVVGVTPLAQGLEIDAGAVTPMISRHDPLPLQRRRTFAAVQKGQNTFCVRVYEGEGATAPDLRLLAEATISEVGRGRFGRTAVEATFALDANGFLEVSLRDPVTGRTQRRDFRDGGLSAADIDRLTREAETQAYAQRGRVEKEEVRDLASHKLAAAEQRLAGLAPGDRAALAPLLDEVRWRAGGGDEAALREALLALDRAVEGLTQYLAGRGSD